MKKKTLIDLDLIKYYIGKGFQKKRKKLKCMAIPMRVINLFYDFIAKFACLDIYSLWFLKTILTLFSFQSFLISLIMMNFRDC